MVNRNFSGEPDRQRYADRREAGRQLAPLLHGCTGRRDAVVFALPRGGVPVAYEVALDLGASLDVFTVRKLGVPGHSELAMGAICSGGAYVLNHDVIDALCISRAQVVAVAKRERHQVERRERLYRASRPSLTLTGKTVIIVDDGLATGASMLVAVEELRQKQPAKIVVAVPVAPAQTCESLRRSADEVICRRAPEHIRRCRLLV